MSDNRLPKGSDETRHLRVADKEIAADRNITHLHPQHVLANVLHDEKHAEDSDEIDLLAYWRLLLKRRWLILGVASAIVAVTLVKTLLTPPIYRATAVLQIDSDGMQVMQVQGMTPYGGYDPDFAETQYKLLQSRSLARRVAEDMHLAGSDIFQRLQPPSWLDRLRNLLSPGSHNAATQTLAAVNVTAASSTPANAPAATDEPDTPTTSTAPTADSASAQLNAATGLIQSGLSITPIRNSHLVQINYDSTLPTFSARVANAVANGFIAASMDRRFGASSYARKYLQDQLSQLRSRLTDSEKALVSFAQKENLVPSSTDGSSLSAQNLTDLNASLAKAQNDRISAQSLWDQAKNAKGAALPAAVLQNSIYYTLKQQLAQLEGQYQDKLGTFKPDYPTMVSLSKNIAEVKKQIDHELASVRASIKANYDAAVANETMLKQQLATLRAQTLDVNSRSIKYNILKRDVDTNRQLYNAVLQRYKEIGLAGGAKTHNIFVVDSAIVPGGRFSPNLTHNVMLGLLLGLAVGIALALLLEYLDDTVKAPLDIENQLHLGVLGVIPKLNKQTPLDALEDPRSMFSESYRSVRTALQFSTDHGVPNVLMVTSTGSGEGKSTTALTLARNFAQLGKHVLLIEGDLRNPSLSKSMGLYTTTGLSSLLAGAATLSQSLTKTDDPHLDVILSGPLPPSPTELLAGSRLISLLTIGVRKYDQIIIDGPPVLGIADAPILANAASATLLVVQSGSTRINAARMAIKRLHAARAKVLGALLTRYDARAHGFDYNYEGYYAYGAPQLTKR